MNKDIRINLTVIGDTGVGKTSLINQFVNHHYTENTGLTIGAEFSPTNVTLNGQEFELYIMDTAGQEQFRTIFRAFFRGVHCCILVYDISRPESFSKVLEWRSYFLEYADIENERDFPFVVIGTKVDMPQGTLTTGPDVCHQAQSMCTSRGWMYFETSAKHNTNVEEAFLMSARLALIYKSKHCPQKSDNTIVLYKSTTLEQNSPTSGQISIDGPVKKRSGCAC